MSDVADDAAEREREEDASDLARLAWLRREIPKAREKLIEMEAEAVHILDDLHIELEVD